MEIIDFNENHVEQAWQLVENAFKNEQKTNKNLPDFSQTCDVKDELRFFAREKLGFAAVEMVNCWDFCVAIRRSCTVMARRTNLAFGRRCTPTVLKTKKIQRF